MGELVDLVAEFETAAEVWRRAPELWGEFATAAGEKIAARLTERVQEEPEPPESPINWDSKKQQVAFFHSDGFGGGIPHVRTGETAESWHSFVETQARGSLRAGAASSFKGALFTRDTEAQSNIFMGVYPTTAEILDEESGFIQSTMQEAVDQFLNEVMGIGGYRPRGVSRPVSEMVSAYSEYINR